MRRTGTELELTETDFNSNGQIAMRSNLEVLKSVQVLHRWQTGGRARLEGERRSTRELLFPDIRDPRRGRQRTNQGPIQRVEGLIMSWGAVSPEGHAPIRQSRVWPAKYLNRYPPGPHLTLVAHELALTKIDAARTLFRCIQSMAHLRK